MKIEINKNSTKVFDFYPINQNFYFYAKGVITFGNNIFIDKEIIEIPDIKNNLSVEKLKKIIPKLNGNFLFCFFDSKNLFIANDRWGFYQLFYIQKDDSTIYSNKWEDLIKFSDKKIDDDNLIEYFSVGHVLNSETLLTDIFEIKPHRIICHYHNKEKEEISYWKLIQNFPSVDVKQKERQFIELWNNRISIYGNFLNQNSEECFIPITGGLDSRLLLSSFDKFGINIHTATWGGDYSYFDIENASNVVSLMKNVSSHKKIIVNEDLIKEEFNSESTFNNITTARPTNETFIAEKFFPNVKYLIPGFSGDFMAGSHLKYKMKYWKSKEDIVEYITKFKTSHIAVYLSKTDSEFKNNLRNLISKSIDNDNDIISAFLRWDVEERQRQYIVKPCIYSEKTWNLLPFFDYELMDFFLNLPFKELVSTKLYINSQIKYFYKDKRKLININRFDSPPKLIINSFFNEYFSKFKELKEIKKGKYKTPKYSYTSLDIDWEKIYNQLNIPDFYKNKEIEKNINNVYLLFFNHYDNFIKKISKK